MKSIRIHIRALCAVALCGLFASTVAPAASAAAYSFGDFEIARYQGGPIGEDVPENGWPAAVAVGVVLGAAFVVGVVDGYRSEPTPEPEPTPEEVISAHYSPADFSHFDG